MLTSISVDLLCCYVDKQLSLFFPDGQSTKSAIESVMPRSLERVEAAFTAISSRYYQKDGQAYFNHLNTDHYAAFLYLLSNECYLQSHERVAEKAFALNKSLHGLDAFFAINLPEKFLFVHPVGTVLGNANYGEHFVVYQNVTIGSDVDGIYPDFGENNVVYSGATVLGKVVSGQGVVFAANCFVKNKQITSNSSVVGQFPNEAFKPRSTNLASHYFK